MNARAEISPIVVDGVMYVTGRSTAAALEVRPGRELWTWRRHHSEGLPEHRIRPGESRPAILDDQIFVATLNCCWLRWTRRAASTDGPPRSRALSPHEGSQDSAFCERSRKVQHHRYGVVGKVGSLAVRSTSE